LRGDYDYNHATSNAQFLAILFAILAIGGLFLGITLLTSIL
jgi:hypothetical protein